jgi:hypothetical protein
MEIIRSRGHTAEERKKTKEQKMNIVGKGKKVIDADLLARLAVNQQSGATISKAEVSSAIESAKSDLQDEFAWSNSSRGLTAATRAIANTLELAVKSGWVRGGSAKDLIEAFVGGENDGSLADLTKDIKNEIRSNRRGSGGYGGRVSGGSYGGYSSRHYGT